MPPSLGVMKPEPSLQPHSPALGLERAGQIQDTMNPTQWTKPRSNHHNAPTWVTSRRYPTRQASYAPNNLFKQLECHLYEQCGICFQLLLIMPLDYMLCYKF
ncbi:hypothetical protein GQ457_11G005720 [Hibiscus cannabinus]